MIYKLSDYKQENKMPHEAWVHDLAFREPKAFNCYCVEREPFDLPEHLGACQTPYVRKDLSVSKEYLKTIRDRVHHIAMCMPEVDRVQCELTELLKYLDKTIEGVTDE